MGGAGRGRGRCLGGVTRRSGGCARWKSSPALRVFADGAVADAGRPRPLGAGWARRRMLGGLATCYGAPRAAARRAAVGSASRRGCVSAVGGPRALAGAVAARLRAVAADGHRAPVARAVLRAVVEGPHGRSPAGCIPSDAPHVPSRRRPRAMIADELGERAIEPARDRDERGAPVRVEARRAGGRRWRASSSARTVVVADAAVGAFDEQRPQRLAQRARPLEAGRRELLAGTDQRALTQPGGQLVGPASSSAPSSIS